MKILGIDPGTATTGWAVVEEKSRAGVQLGFCCFLNSLVIDELGKLGEVYFIDLAREVKMTVAGRAS